MSRSIHFILFSLFLLAAFACAQTKLTPPAPLAPHATITNPPLAVTPLSARNTVTLQFHTPQPYLNGLNQPDFQQTLVAFPNLATLTLHRTTHSVDIDWKWLMPPASNTSTQPSAGTTQSSVLSTQPSLVSFSSPQSLACQLVELPGPATYLLQFTWDADAGLFEAYLNGTPMILPHTRFTPWSAPAPCTTAQIPPSPIFIDNLTVTNQYTTPDALQKSVPPTLLHQHADLLGYPPLNPTAPTTQPFISQDPYPKIPYPKTPSPSSPLSPPPPPPSPLHLGKLLLSLNFANPADLQNWKMEGPGRAQIIDHALQLQSADPTKHLVFWCPQNLPDHFVADWDFAPISHYGLAIVFFAATGDHGQDIFDPALPPRNATFSQYTAGRILSYHISYFANLSDYQTARPTSNLRKNNQFFALAQGPIAIPPQIDNPPIENRKLKIENPQFSHLRLIKDGPHIQLLSNNQISIDFADTNPTRFGPPLTTGKFGLRQMSETIAQYKNLEIHELAP